MIKPISGVAYQSNTNDYINHNNSSKNTKSKEDIANKNKTNSFKEVFEAVKETI